MMDSLKVSKPSPPRKAGTQAVGLQRRRCSAWILRSSRRMTARGGCLLRVGVGVVIDGAYPDGNLDSDPDKPWMPFYWSLSCFKVFESP